MKNKFVKKIFAAVFLLAAVLIFASCENNKKTTDTHNEVTTVSEDVSDDEIETDINETETDETEEDTEDSEDSENDTAEDTKPKTTRDPNYVQGAPLPVTYYSYLTGEECTRKKQKKRPVSIIINNYKPAMPNVGISRADIIYECIVEGGITRLMMVLSDYEDIKTFGSVRSSREYFIDLSRTHDTIYVHAGGNPQDYDQFDMRPAIERIDGVNMNFPNTFYRDQVRRQTMALEHTLMTSGAGIVKGIEERKYRTTLPGSYKGAFKFYNELTDIGGTDNTANYICVPYSNAFKPEFIYNPDDMMYYRNQYGAAHIDGETSEQIKFNNVIVLFAKYAPFRGNEIAKKEGHLSCELTGSGYGFYITGGKYKIIRWKKDTREGMLNLFNRDNTDLQLNQGKSFICVTSTDYNKSVVINSELRDLK